VIRNRQEAADYLQKARAVAGLVGGKVTVPVEGSVNISTEGTGIPGGIRITTTVIPDRDIDISDLIDETYKQRDSRVDPKEPGKSDRSSGSVGGRYAVECVIGFAMQQRLAHRRADSLRRQLMNIKCP